MSFEWDETKNQSNIQKHDVGFEEAQDAFLDPNRIIIRDSKHSMEKNGFSVLAAQKKALQRSASRCVKQTYVLLELDIGEKEKIDMSKKIIYTKAPDDISDQIRSGEKLNDFLPPPDQLVKKNPKIKVTISLNSRSIDFFKNHAKKNNVKYQTMINEVLDQYAQKYSEH